LANKSQMATKSGNRPKRLRTLSRLAARERLAEGEIDPAINAHQREHCNERRNQYLHPKRHRVEQLRKLTKLPHRIRSFGTVVRPTGHMPDAAVNEADDVEQETILTTGRLLSKERRRSRSDLADVLCCAAVTAFTTQLSTYPSPTAQEAPECHGDYEGLKHWLIRAHHRGTQKSCKQRESGQCGVIVPVKAVDLATSSEPPKRSQPDAKANGICHISEIAKRFGDYARE